MRERDHNLFRLQRSLSLSILREKWSFGKGKCAQSLVDSIMSSLSPRCRRTLCVHTHNKHMTRPTDRPTDRPGFCVCVYVFAELRPHPKPTNQHTSQHNSGVSRDFRRLPPLFGFLFSFPVFALCDDGCCISCVLLDPQHHNNVEDLPNPSKGVGVNRNK